MQPPAPARFRRIVPARFGFNKLVSQPILIMLRNQSHHPLRAAFTFAGTALAPAIIIVSLFLIDTTEDLIDVTFFMSDRQDASVNFVERRPVNVVQEIARLPGVLAVEPYREVPVSHTPPAASFDSKRDHSSDCGYGEHAASVR